MGDSKKCSTLVASTKVSGVGGRNARVWEKHTKKGLFDGGGEEG
jgi:hypothetical protein